MNFVWMVLLTLGIVQLSALATTVYLHRSVTHRGLELHPAIAFLMLLELTLFTGIVPREWAAVHRKHHHFSDQEGDPHSPYIFGMWKVLFGNFFMYRKEAGNPATVRKYTPDYKPDLIDRIPANGLGVYLGMGIFMLMFGLLWGVVAWVAHVVIYILVNAMINSLGHTIGYRNWDNKATNLRWLAWISGGEGLHNNHHEFPTAARFSMRKSEIDPAWGFIKVLETLGLAKVKPQPLAKVA